MEDTLSASLEAPKELGKSPASIARRWKLELKLADKRESAWRNKVKTIYGIYTPETPVSNSFNILWPNTETLRQAVYNSLPQPMVRRRYSDEDPLGRAVGDVLTRSLEFSQDTYDFDGVLKGDVLAMLLCGRALSRVRYVPDIRSTGPSAGTDEESPDIDPEAANYEEIAWEQVVCERVQWDDFRILCNAKTWDDVTAIAFRHHFTREDCVEKFGEEVGNRITLNGIDDDDVQNAHENGDLFKTAEIWEIWSKDDKQVLFICKTYPEPCKIQDDPMELSGFFPIPRPLYAIESDVTLIPSPLYSQYEQQAKELNRISIRINKLIEGLKLRGIYDSTLGELADMMKATDNELVPAANVTALLERGGLDKAIWMMPIETAASVLGELYKQRDSTKQIIYEITGISDIMRSASDPQETYGAQRIKTQWGTQRLQRMQKETQRYIRDLIRLKAEVIAEKFQMPTLEAMTLIKMPHQPQIDQQKMAAMQQYAMQAHMAQMQGQQPPPPPQFPPDPITWDAVCAAMKDDATRTYKVDIETDSTLSATQDSDMEGLKEVLTGVQQIMTGFGPAVQQGAMPVEVLKELMLVVIRRAKMGSAVEDAFEKIKQPPPPPDPNAGKAQAQIQIEQAKLQAAGVANQQQLQFEQQKAQIDAQVEAHKQQVQAQQVAQQQQLEAQREDMQQRNEAALEQMRIASDERMRAMEMQVKDLISQRDSAVKLEVAELAAQTTLQTAQISAANQGVSE